LLAGSFSGKTAARLLRLAAIGAVQCSASHAARTETSQQRGLKLLVAWSGHVRGGVHQLRAHLRLLRLLDITEANIAYNWSYLALRFGPCWQPCIRILFQYWALFSSSCILFLQPRTPEALGKLA
jgi:hypothetical protein